MSEQTPFTGDYYRRTIEEFGYDPAFFSGFTGPLQDIPSDKLERLFLCHSGLYDFDESAEPKAVTTGFGLSGVPHLGTLSQMVRASELNRAGYFTQLVLGDLDAYNGKQVPLADTRRLAEQYQAFIASSGLFDKDNSVVRDQYSHPSVLRTAYLLGRFITDQAMEATDEDLHGFYVARGKVDSTMSYRRKLSLNLMMADFFDLGPRYPEVLVMLGIDEHKYVLAAQQLSSCIEPGQSELTVPNIRSLYTPMLRGLRGYPKMSKSFPESGITLDMSTDAIAATIMDDPGGALAPEENVLVQIAAALGIDEIIPWSSILESCTAGGSAWYDVKQTLIAQITAYASIWQDAA